MPLALVAAFFAAFGYAVIAGTKPCDLGSEIGFFAGSQVALAGGLTLFSIAWLFRDYETHGRAVASARRLLGLTILIIGFFLLLAVSDYDFDRSKAGHTVSDSLLVGIPLFAPMLFGIIVGALRSSRWLQRGRD